MTFAVGLDVKSLVLIVGFLFLDVVLFITHLE